MGLSCGPGQVPSRPCVGAGLSGPGPRELGRTGSCQGPALTGGAERCLALQMPQRSQSPCSGARGHLKPFKCSSHNLRPRLPPPGSQALCWERWAKAGLKTPQSDPAVGTLCGLSRAEPRWLGSGSSPGMEGQLPSSLGPSRWGWDHRRVSALTAES